MMITNGLFRADFRGSLILPDLEPKAEFFDMVFPRGSCNSGTRQKHLRALGFYVKYWNVLPVNEIQMPCCVTKI